MKGPLMRPLANSKRQMLTSFVNRLKTSLCEREEIARVRAPSASIGNFVGFGFPETEIRHNPSLPRPEEVQTTSDRLTHAGPVAFQLPDVRRLGSPIGVPAGESLNW
jgi:hypothetical protein